MTETLAETKKRRAPSLLITGVVGLVIALLAGGAGVLVRYQPLRPGTTSMQVAGSEQVDSTDQSDPRPTEQVHYVDGRTITFGFSITNGGHWGVTVTGFSESTGGLLEDFAFQDEGSAFKPFALRPGAGRGITVTARFANCEAYATGTSATLESVFVRFTIFGLRRTADIPLSQKIAVLSPSNADCPRPRAA